MISKLKEWKLEDEIKTKDDLIEYISQVLGMTTDYMTKTVISDADFRFIAVGCRDFLDIAKKKGWLK